MDHPEAIELLGDSLAGRFEARKNAELREHLDGCEKCRTWDEDYRLFAAALGGEAGEHPSSEQLARQAADPGLLAPPEQDWVSEHVQICAECRQQLVLTTGALSFARRSRGFQRLFNGPSSRPRALTRRLAMAACLLLAVALGFVYQGSPFADAERDRVLSSRDLRDSQVVVAAGSITAAAVTIEAGTEVVLRAGESVILTNGFSVGHDATLMVETGHSAPAAPSPEGV